MPAPNLEKIHSLFDEARDRSIELDGVTLSFAPQSRLERLMERVAARPDDPGEMQSMTDAAAQATRLGGLAEAFEIRLG